MSRHCDGLGTSVTKVGDGELDWKDSMAGGFLWGGTVVEPMM